MKEEQLQKIKKYIYYKDVVSKQELSDYMKDKYIYFDEK